MIIYHIVLYLILDLYLGMLLLKKQKRYVLHCSFEVIILCLCLFFVFFFFQAEDGIRDRTVTGVQTCALPISIATGIGGLQSYQDCYDTLLERGPDRVNPFAIPCIIPNMGAGWVSMQLGTRGPLASQCTACAASNMAIGDGTDQIRLGRADVMLCGGTEAGINEVGIAGFGAVRALPR